MTPLKTSYLFRLYNNAVSLGGPLLAIALAVHGANSVAAMDPNGWVRAGLLLLFATVALGLSLQIGHKLTFEVGEAAAMAIILLMPLDLTGAMVLVAGCLYLIFRGKGIEPDHDLFNLGQLVLWVTGGAYSLSILRHYPWLGPSIANLNIPIGAIAICALVMIVGNTLLVALAIRFLAGGRILHLWKEQLSGLLGIGTRLLLMGVGVLAALVVRDYPLAFPALLLPAISLHTATRRYVALRSETRAAMAMLVEVIEMRDPYTSGHSRRVGELSRKIAIQLGLTADEADLIETAGFVHDIGKIALNSSILLKYGELDALEWSQLKRHPDDGANVISRFSVYRACADYVRYHHERWDGSGFPRQLTGEEIPLGARILAVADAFDALIHQRSYRAAKTREETFALLEAGARRQWDPAVVQALLALRPQMEQDEAVARGMVPAVVVA